MKKLFLFGMLSLSLSAQAATGTILKSSKPGNIYCSGCYSSSYMGVLSTDFPSGTLNKRKTLTSVQYTWYPYPGTTSLKTELCYDKPYQSTQGNCIDITAAQTGTTTFYNNFLFDMGSTFYIRHTVTSGTSPRLPSSTPDQVRMNFTY